MNRKLSFLVPYCMIIMIISFATSFIAISSAWAKPQQTDFNEETVLKYLRPALNSAKKTARLYYFEACDNEENAFVSFPRISVRPFPKNKKGLEAVRQIFKDDKAVTVTELGDDIIRVKVGKAAPHPILRTKIRSVRLDAGERYTPQLAILAIKNTKEVEAAAARFGLRGPPVMVYSTSVQLPIKGLPHLPAVMKDITIDEALDAVAKTFGVMVVFGECVSKTGAHLFHVYTVELD